jgi:hypothetical protein
MPVQECLLLRLEAFPRPPQAWGLGEWVARPRLQAAFPRLPQAWGLLEWEVRPRLQVFLFFFF